MDQSPSRSSMAPSIEELTEEMSRMVQEVSELTGISMSQILASRTSLGTPVTSVSQLLASVTSLHSPMPPLPRAAWGSKEHDSNERSITSHLSVDKSWPFAIYPRCEELIQQERMPPLEKYPSPTVPKKRSKSRAMSSLSLRSGCSEQTLTSIHEEDETKVVMDIMAEVEKVASKDFSKKKAFFWRRLRCLCCLGKKKAATTKKTKVEEHEQENSEVTQDAVFPTGISLKCSGND
ncbi:unnamed protein product [Coregonus sp. 'balchen']|uniref:uncharacterized protein LOC121562518 n=1 Tax=Coregonus clupeaformis TaxID=59861 RepID=UPI0013E4F5E2|nr:uncharacterized protein LOC121562518 [Coregonus clupeaformis]CAB1339279.1 unnamed protein product [Coregonus sp. 'balchen']